MLVLYENKPFHHVINIGTFIRYERVYIFETCLNMNELNKKIEVLLAPKEKPIHERECEKCETVFSGKGYGCGRFCSRKCYRAYISMDYYYRNREKIRLQVKDSRHGKNALKCFERDNFTCQKCGKQAKTIREILQFIPHRINFNEKDNRLENLLTLCRSCHSVLHRELEEKAVKSASENQFIKWTKEIISLLENR